MRGFDVMQWSMWNGIKGKDFSHCFPLVLCIKTGLLLFLASFFYPFVKLFVIPPLQSTLSLSLRFSVRGGGMHRPAGGLSTGVTSALLDFCWQLTPHWHLLFFSSTSTDCNYSYHHFRCYHRYHSTIKISLLNPSFFNLQLNIYFYYLYHRQCKESVFL